MGGEGGHCGDTDSPAGLVEFLSACLDEDERVARAADDGKRWRYDGMSSNGPRVMTGDGPEAWNRDVNSSVWICEDEADGCPDLAREWAAEGEHIARWDPARVLAEVAAKRAVLGLLRRAEDGAEDERAAVLREAVRVLAQPFAGRPGWRPEWATEVEA